LTSLSPKCYKTRFTVAQPEVCFCLGRSSGSDAAKPQTTVLDVEARFRKLPVRR
jgi:hypothetical protein